jgi:hypothetical protein
MGAISGQGEKALPPQPGTPEALRARSLLPRGVGPYLSDDELRGLNRMHAR